MDILKKFTFDHLFPLRYIFLEDLLFRWNENGRLVSDHLIFLEVIEGDAGR